MLIDTIKEFLTQNKSLDLEVLSLIVWVASCCSVTKAISNTKVYDLLSICKSFLKMNIKPLRAKVTEAIANLLLNDIRLAGNCTDDNVILNRVL